jgi:hypothetical protein
MARQFAAAWGRPATPNLWRPNPSRVALAAATLMAFTFWPVHFSRYGIRAILFVPIVALAAAAWLAIVPRGEPGSGGEPGSRGKPPLRGQALSRGGATEADGTSPQPLKAIAALAVLLAAATYAHPAGRALVVLPALHAAWIWGRTQNASVAGRLAVAVAGAAVLVLPLAMFWFANPSQFAGHAGEVSVLAEGPRVVGQNVVRVLTMFHLGGDPAPWRNLARPLQGLPQGWSLVGQGRSAFDKGTGILMLIGVGAAVAAWRRGSMAAVIVFVWFTGLLVPSMLTDAAPNFSRAIGTLPFAVLLAALGADRVAGLVPRRAGAWVVAGWLAVAAGVTLRDYFVTYAQAPETPRAFDAEKAALGRVVADVDAHGCSPLVAGELSQHPTVEVTAGQDVRGFDVSEGVPATVRAIESRIVWPPAGRCVALVFLDSASGAYVTAEGGDSASGTDVDAAGEESASGTDAASAGGERPWLSLARALDQWTDATVQVVPVLPGNGAGDEPAGQPHPQADVLDEVSAGTVVVTSDDSVIVRATAPYAFLDDIETAFSPESIVWKQWAADGPLFGSAFRLAEAVFFHNGTRRPAQAVLVWEVVASPPEALSLFVHARSADGTKVAQDDGWPLGPLAPSESLRVGERFVSAHTLDVSGTGQPLSLVVGWYDWRDLARLPVTGGAEELEDDGAAYRVGVVGETDSDDTQP